MLVPVLAAGMLSKEPTAFERNRSENRRKGQISSTSTPAADTRIA